MHFYDLLSSSNNFQFPPCARLLHLGSEELADELHHLLVQVVHKVIKILSVPYLGLVCLQHKFSDLITKDFRFKESMK